MLPLLAFGVMGLVTLALVIDGDDADDPVSDEDAETPEPVEPLGNPVLQEVEADTPGQGTEDPDLFWTNLATETGDPVVIDDFDDQQDILALSVTTEGLEGPYTYSLDIEYDEESDLTQVTATLHGQSDDCDSEKSLTVELDGVEELNENAIAFLVDPTDTSEAVGGARPPFDEQPEHTGFESDEGRVVREYYLDANGPGADVYNVTITEPNLVGDSLYEPPSSTPLFYHETNAAVNLTLSDNLDTIDICVDPEAGGNLHWIETSGEYYGSSSHEYYTDHFKLLIWTPSEVTDMFVSFPDNFGETYPDTNPEDVRLLAAILYRTEYSGDFDNSGSGEWDADTAFDRSFTADITLNQDVSSGSNVVVW
jgi:hypothetical protein